MTDQSVVAQKEETDKVDVSFRMPKASLDVIDKMATDECRSRSSLILFIVEKYIRQCGTGAE